MGVRQRMARGLRRHVRSQLAGRRDPALMNAGALDDPFVRRVDFGGQFFVSENAVRQVAAAAEDDRSRDCHEAAPPKVLPTALSCRTPPSVDLLSSVWLFEI